MNDPIVYVLQVQNVKDLVHKIYDKIVNEHTQDAEEPVYLQEDHGVSILEA